MTSLTLQAASSLAAAGPEWEPLFEAGPGFQSQRAWFDAIVEAALPQDARPLVWMVRDGERPLLLLPMLSGPGRRLGSLTAAYTCQFQPLAAPGTAGTAFKEAGTLIGNACRAWPAATLEALDADWPGLPPFLAGLREAGMVARRFTQFGNWHQPVEGCTWEAYLATRPGSLRETIRRKGKVCDRDASVRFEEVRGGTGIGPALAAYEDVYARSWKQPEPSPDFNRALLHRAAAAGALRLGVMRVAGQAVAAQYWVVWRGVATVLKLAHDDAWRALSPGTLLTAYMIRGLIGEGGIAGLDFGRGDDAYKQLWADGRRQRIGVLLANSRRPGGALALARHDAGTWLRRTRKAAKQHQV